MAETLFGEARQLMSEGRYAEACRKFASSDQLDPGVGTLLNLALCYEKNGQLASAWSSYREAAARARAAGQSERARVANQEAERLASQLGKLRLDVTDEVVALPGLRLALDGAEVPRELWGTELPMDAGEHTLTASAQGRLPQTLKVTSADGAVAALAVPVLEVEPRSRVASEPAQAVELDSGVPVAAPPAGAARFRYRTLAWTLGGIGVLGLGASGIFGLSAQSTYSESEPECSTKNICTEKGLTLREDGERKARIATISGGVGLALIAGAGILLLSEPGSSSSSNPETARFGVRARPTGFDLVGQW